jgi:hypothetical protein
MPENLPSLFNIYFLYNSSGHQNKI